VDDGVVLRCDDGVPQPSVGCNSENMGLHDYLPSGSVKASATALPSAISRSNP
jgi:hypothetical protein